MMAFSGVRSSWLILARKRDLPEFRVSASSRAAISSASRAAPVVESRSTPATRPSEERFRSRAQVRSGAPSGAKAQVEAPDITAEAKAAASTDRSAWTAISTMPRPSRAEASTPSGA